MRAKDFKCVKCGGLEYSLTSSKLRKDFPIILVKCLKCGNKAVIKNPHLTKH